MGWASAVRGALCCARAAAAAGAVRGPGLGPGPGPGPVRSMCAQADDWRSAKAIYDFHALDIDGNDVSLEKYRGDVCIITNVASK
uniref:Putative glutathione peroxidase 4 n=1 Tax=Taeniopygia guttata TaxID=59729 RepID=B5G1Z3_TAEGU|nr:putative glutathione peroxidase 4 [Taeniopygia guttata]